MRADEEELSRYRRQSAKSNGKSGINSVLVALLVIVALMLAVLIYQPSIIQILTGGPSPQASETEDSALLQGEEPQQIDPIDTTNIQTQSMEEIANSLTELSTSMQEIAEQVNFLIGANQRDNAQFRKIDNQINSLDSQIDSSISQVSADLSRQINNVASGIETNIERLDTLLQAEQARNAETNTLITGNIEQMQQDLINLNSLFRSQLERSQQLERDIANLNSRLTDLER